MHGYKNASASKHMAPRKKRESLSRGFRIKGIFQFPKISRGFFQLTHLPVTRSFDAVGNGMENTWGDDPPSAPGRHSPSAFVSCALPRATRVWTRRVTPSSMARTEHTHVQVRKILSLFEPLTAAIKQTSSMLFAVILALQLRYLKQSSVFMPPEENHGEKRSLPGFRIR